MPCEILIKATTPPGAPFKKGYLSVVRDLPWIWGLKETLPDWVRVRITDADASEVEFFLANWYLTYEVTTVQDIVPRARLRFEIDPSVISASGLGRDEIKANMLTWVTTQYVGGSIVNSSVSHILADFEKPLTSTQTGATTIAEITAAFADIFDVMFDVTRYYVSESDVDTIIAPPNDGFIAITQAEALATVNDKFLD